MIKKDFVGKRFGRLVVQDVFHKKLRNGKKILACLCVCDCGKTATPLKCNLQNKTCRSCGCLGVESRKTHGLTLNKKKPELYNIWDGMLRRSSGKKQAQRSSTYMKISKDFGIYEPWKSFEQFCKDMGPRPNKDHSLERIDNNKGYYPENCKWATKSEQMYNTNRSKIIEIYGEKIKTSDFKRKYKIPPGGIKYWTKKGYNLNQIADHYKKLRGL